MRSLNNRMARLERVAADAEAPQEYAVIIEHLDGTATFNSIKYADVAAARAAAARPCIVVECIDGRREEVA